MGFENGPQETGVEIQKRLDAERILKDREELDAETFWNRHYTTNLDAEQARKLPFGDFVVDFAKEVRKGVGQFNAMTPQEVGDLAEWLLDPAQQHLLQGAILESNLTRGHLEELISVAAGKATSDRLMYKDEKNEIRKRLDPYFQEAEGEKQRTAA